MNISDSELLKIQERFHALIKERTSRVITDDFIFPDLLSNPQSLIKKRWLPVEGFYGGFKYWLDHEKNILLSESWCRIAGGSGQRHEISPDQTILIEEGFV